jgi:hypothetical protein
VILRGVLDGELEVGWADFKGFNLRDWGPVTVFLCTAFTAGQSGEGFFGRDGCGFINMAARSKGVIGS